VHSSSKSSAMDKFHGNVLKMVLELLIYPVGLEFPRIKFIIL
jgi:hypothetical protein